MPNETIQRLFSTVQGWMAWAPDWVFPSLIVLAAALVALALHGALVRILRRWVGQRSPYLRSLFTSTKGATRLALVVFVVSLFLPLIPLTPQLEATFSRLLAIAFIVVTGWFATIATNMAAEFYLNRFDIRVEDNLLARKHVTQVRILKRLTNTLIILVTVAAALMTLEQVRQYGVSLFVSAGVAGLVVGLAARPVLANLLARVQIAMTQPIRMDDAVVVEGKWGWIEEITSTYVVVRLWDWRRLIVPLSCFIEQPFQNWTRENAAIIGTVMIHTDYSVPVARVREKLEEIVKTMPLWDGRVVNLQVTEAKEQSLELRVLVSARTSPQAWDLRCDVREKLVDFLQQEYPDALPRSRVDIGRTGNGPLRRRGRQAKGSGWAAALNSRRH